ncbi:MAG TPA: putative metal-dependent hydrolase [Saprospiraceae bacterium]|nr:putative metal-dependent hydrolase [Saprospiraceae bacterium]
MELTLDQLKYPVGKWKWPETVTENDIREAIVTIADLPSQLIEAVKGLNDQQLDTPYRPDGWTIRQVVHHLADSHMNAYMRFKLALTEDNPTIKPYDQAKWAELEDNKAEPMVSIMIITGIHKRWVDIMQHMSAEEWFKTLKHPEHNRQLVLNMLAMQYAWHGRHHLMHILKCRERNGF